jgi:hypothetical protein
MPSEVGDDQRRLSVAARSDGWFAQCLVPPTSKAKKLGELRPKPAPAPKPITRTDPSEPEEATVIPATLSKPKHAASEYGQALSDAPWENRIDTSRDLSDGIDPDLLPPEQFLE